MDANHPQSPKVSLQVTMTREKFTLGRHERVRGRAEIDGIFAHGKSAGDKVLTVIVVPNGLPHVRVCVGASKKWGSAPRRNRLKRLMREAFRLEKHELPVGLDYMIMPRVEAEKMTLEAARKSLLALARRAAKRVDTGKSDN